MDEGSIEISPRLVETGNYIRESPSTRWRRVGLITDGQINVGRHGPANEHGTPSIAASELEPAFVFTVDQGEKLYCATSAVIEVKTERVAAQNIGRNQVVEVPGHQVAAMVTNYLEGESSGSGSRHFTCTGIDGQPYQFDSYFRIDGQDGWVENDSITRVVRD